MAKRSAEPKDPKSTTDKTSKDAVGASRVVGEANPVVAEKTRTLPESQRGAWLDVPDVVTMLRIFDTANEFELPASVKRFTLGSAPDCDVCVRDPSLSKLHCLFERRGTALRVTDQASYNGTFFDGRREMTFDLRPGNTFTAAGIRFLALNDEMRTAYPRLADIVGAEDEDHDLPRVSTPSELILVATNGSHLLITGEPGCDQDQLARLLHSISLRRRREVVELIEVPTDRAQQRAILDRAGRSTILIAIGDQTPVMDGTLASSLFSPTFQVRVIASAPTTSIAGSVLGQQNLGTMRVVPLRPLSMRASAIPRILDRFFIERHSPLRVADMTAANQAALQAYSWPKNLVDLRLAADRLTVLHDTRSQRAAATRLGLHHSSLQAWLERLGLSFPREVE